MYLFLFITKSFITIKKFIFKMSKNCKTRESLFTISNSSKFELNIADQNSDEIKKGLVILSYYSKIKR